MEKIDVSKPFDQLNKIDMVLENTSEYGIDHFLFDPQAVVDTYLDAHPNF